MKMLLPIPKNLSINKTTNSNEGFTLIELMIVVAIIGILALVGLGVFSGAQGSARDARREVEIDALAKNIESTRDPQTKGYVYTDSTLARDYPTGLTDPGDAVINSACSSTNCTIAAVPGVTSGNPYCQQGSSNPANPPAPPSASGWSNDGSCPTGWGPISGTKVCCVTGVLDLTNLGVSAPKSWTVCAKLERSNKVFCKSNVLR